MIVIGFFGGLASQMNQYAFMCEIRRRFPNVEIKAAIADYWMYEGQHNGFELDKVFGISLEAVERFKLIKLAEFYPGSGFFARISNKFYGLKKALFGSSQITIADPTIFEPSVFDIDVNKDVFFWSNYIAEEYFCNSNDIIKKDFTFKTELDDLNQKLIDKIRTSNSVSIHVRHGDYKKYGFSILPIEYYKKAVSLINNRIEKPVYYVFSDDKDYIMNAFDFLDNVVLVTNNSGKISYKDMQLMSQCKHNIIANSGFSFWGAWLNNNPDKIVIAPQKHVPWCKKPIALREWTLI